MEEEILNYFNHSYPKGNVVKPIDNKYCKYYTGVTLRYITYSLLKAKYKKSEVAKCLLDLHKSGKIKGLYCNGVKNYVIQPKGTYNGNFSQITGDSNWGVPGINLHKYLETFIK